MVSETVSYALNREDLILSGFFDPKETGFYVDVGANDPLKDSVTKLFYDRGWQGINIEPIERHYQNLAKERPRDINLNLGVGKNEGELTLREYVRGTGLSTFSIRMQRGYSKDGDPITNHYTDHQVPVTTLAKIFTQHSAKHIHFMKIDVEGFEYEVLVGNDWQRFRPEVICVEANHIEKDWRKLLKQHDYMLAFFDGLNEYYVDKNKPERLKKFSFVDAVVLKEPIVHYKLLPKIEAYDRLQDLEKEIQIKNQYITHLENLLSEVTPLRRHVRRQFKRRFRSVDQKIRQHLSSQHTYAPSVISAADDLRAALRQADVASFKQYNASNHQPTRLRVYLTWRRLAINVLTRMLRMTKV